MISNPAYDATRTKSMFATIINNTFISVATYSTIRFLFPDNTTSTSSSATCYRSFVSIIFNVCSTKPDNTAYRISTYYFSLIGIVIKDISWPVSV